MTLTTDQQDLFNKVMTGVYLGCLWTGNRLMVHNFKRFLNPGAGNHLPNYMDRQDWIRGGIHYFLVQFQKDVNYFRKDLPETQEILRCIQIALRLTGNKIRMTENETLNLLAFFGRAG